MQTENTLLLLKSILENITPISDEIWGDFIEKRHEKSIKKGAFLWKEGQVCKHLVFLKSGLIRSFNHSGEKEITYNFYEKNALFYDDYSFLSQKPCTKNFQALEASEVLIFPRNHLLNLYDRHKAFERIGRIAIETAHIQMIENKERLNLHSAEFNYLYLLENHSELLQQVPLKIIASYLLISTEHLSRIRAKITQSKD